MGPDNAHIWAFVIAFFLQASICIGTLWYLATKPLPPRARRWLASSLVLAVGIAFVVVTGRLCQINAHCRNLHIGRPFPF